MGWIAESGDWIMIASGVLTATMVQAAFMPRQATDSMFGETLEGPLAEIIVRNWGVLVTLVGLSLIYGGWTSSMQGPILIIAGVSKVTFIALVLGGGRRYLRRPAGFAAAADAVFVMLFAAILFTPG